MVNQVGKNRKTQQQEAKIEELKKHLKKRKSVLKGLKTRLKNYQTKISDFQTRGISQMMHYMERMDVLRHEIARLSLELKEKETVNQADKQQLEMMAEELADDEMMGPDYESYKKAKEEGTNFQFDFGEDERAKMFDIFQEFQVAPEQEEQKDIRKIFIRLSNKLHPDKAKDEKQAAAYHQVMLQINEAYQSNDVQTLLELEARYLDQPDFETEESIEVITDILEQQTNQLEQETFLINGQIDRLSTEIKNLRYSQLGLLLSQLEQAENAGQGFDESLKQMEVSVKEMEELKNILEESVNMGMISLNMQQWIKKAQQTTPKFEDINDWAIERYGENPDPEDILNDIFGGKGSVFFDEDEEVEDPTYPLGSVVKISKQLMHGDINAKGFQGQVIDIYYDPDSGEESYAIELDSKSMKSLPLDMVQEMVEEGSDIQEIEYVPVSKLKKAKPRDTPQQRLAVYRQLNHQFYWLDVAENEAQIKRLHQILMQQPGLTDQENWSMHFSENVSFPFEASYAISRKRKKKIYVEGFTTFDQENGHVIFGSTDSDTEIHLPFIVLHLPKDSTEVLHQLHKDYKLWAKEFFLY